MIKLTIGILLDYYHNQVNNSRLWPVYQVPQEWACRRARVVCTSGVYAPVQDSIRRVLKQFDNDDLDIEDTIEQIKGYLDY